MGSCANAKHFYGIQLPEEYGEVIEEDWDAHEKALKPLNLKWYMDGCHVVGPTRMYVGNFETSVWQQGPRKIKKAPSPQDLAQVDMNIKAFCKLNKLKYQKPAWWLIAYYG